VQSVNIAIKIVLKICPTSAHNVAAELCVMWQTSELPDGVECNRAAVSYRDWRGLEQDHA